MNFYDRILSQSQQMLDYLRDYPEFMPSKYWQEINNKNLEMLTEGGLDNFKRTLAHNYYSWLIVSNHPQLTFLKKIYPIKSLLISFFIEYEKNVKVRTTTEKKSFTLSKKQIKIYSLFVALVWQRMKDLDKLKLSEKVFEPKLGNPINITIKRPFGDPSTIITQDLANSILECNTICEHLHPKNSTRVAEIGAGSGRLAHVYCQTQQGKYFIFDIPPALAISQNYLSEVLPHKRIFKFKPFQSFDTVKSEIETSDIIFLSSNQLILFPNNYFDLVLSISTLPEMTESQVRLFLSQFDRLSRCFIFIKQWKDSWQNPQDGTLLRKDDYYFPNTEWNLVIDTIDPINPQFFNRMWKKSNF